MKKTILLLAHCIITSLALAQSPSIQWQKCLGGTINENANYIEVTPDGGYILAGYSSSNDGDVSGNHGYYDAWLVKLANTGAIQWQKSIGGSYYDYANSIKPTSDGGYIMAGYTLSNDGNATGNHGLSDAWVVKLSSTGNVQWQKCFGGTADDSANSIQQTTDGGYIIVGYTNSIDGDISESHYGNAWIVKLSNTGNIQWQKTLGSTNGDYANSVEQTSDGGYILSGSATGTSGDNDALIIKLSNIGDIQWSKTIGGRTNTGAFGNDYAKDIKTTSDGGYIMLGQSNSAYIENIATGYHGGWTDILLVKLSDAGDIEWLKCFGANGANYGNSIQITTDGNYILAGSVNVNNGDVSGLHGNDGENNDAWVLKVSNTGSLMWQKCLGGIDREDASSIKPTADGGYIIAGDANYNDGDVSGSHGNQDAWVVKLDSTLFNNTFNTKELTIYPNPTNNLLQLQEPLKIYFEKIIVIDSTGKTVIEQTQNTTQVNVERLASGIYIIKAFTAEEIFVSKFVKK